MCETILVARNMENNTVVKQYMMELCLYVATISNCYFVIHLTYVKKWHHYVFH